MSSNKKAFLALGMLCVAVAMALAVPAGAFWGGRGTAVTAKDNLVLLPEKNVSEKASYYFIKIDRDGKTKDVVFFAVRDGNGAVHLALDACEACWKEGKGYTQDGKFFRCNNCDMLFNVARIGTKKGGCNPHPVSFSLLDGSIVIPLEDLVDGARYFD